MYGTVFLKEHKQEGDCKLSMKPWSLLYKTESIQLLNNLLKLIHEFTTQLSPCSFQ